MVDVADVAAGHLLADERGAPGERYILGTRNYTWDRLFAELERLSGIEGPALELPVGVALALAEAGARGPLPAAGQPGRDPRGRAVVDVQVDQGAARARLDDAAARGHGRGDRALVGGAARRPAAARAARPAGGLEARRRRRAGGGGDRWPARPLSPSCSTAAARRPTGCARAGASRARCGATGYEVEERRVPWRRGERDEVDALTGQRVVPVAVLGREAICDSRRILEHLRWRG